jgi:hypothetical protein
VKGVRYELIVRVSDDFGDDKDTLYFKIPTRMQMG